MDPTFETALNDFYKLKSKYEDINAKNRKTIINNSQLSKKEKQREFQRLKPKCINCKKPGGTLFTNALIDKRDSSRHLSAVCGVRENPCNLKIIIEVSPYYLLSTILTEQEQDIKEYKNQIIALKNSILFGYSTLEKVMPKFDDYKKLISDSMELYSSYLEEYSSVIDNKSVKEETTRNKIEIQGLISSIKEAIHEFNKTTDEQFIIDATNIYINKLVPLMSALMTLRYKENIVRYDDDDQVYRLIQRTHGIKDIEFNVEANKVLSNDTGVKVNIKRAL
jgi:hypothetical protein